MTILGFDEAAWEAAKSEGREVLIACARDRKMIPYSEFIGTFIPCHSRARMICDFDLSSEKSLKLRTGRVAECLVRWSSISMAITSLALDSSNLRRALGTTRPTSKSSGFKK